MISALEALEQLRQGNRNCIAGFNENGVIQLDTLRQELLSGQEPFAVILGCSDSRAPIELIFDQGLGDLFVIRIAGNVVYPSQIGSVEFAVEKFGTRLVVVMGHTHCGAVQATYDQIIQPEEAQSSHLETIVRKIRPSVDPLLLTGLKNDPHALVHEATRVNIRRSANALRTGSPFLSQEVKENRLLIVGAEYDLATGEVEFFDGVPADS
jgi:carbonic anhydrase